MNNTQQAATQAIKNALPETLPEHFSFLYKGRDTLYTASYVAAFDKYLITGTHWTDQQYYSRYDTEILVAGGTWKLVEPKKALPDTFEFNCSPVSSDGVTYTFKRVGDDSCVVSWMYEDVLQEYYGYTVKDVAKKLEDGDWLFGVLKCENDDEGNTANIPPTAVASIYDPISFLMGAMNQGTEENNLEECAACCEEYCEEISLLEAIKSFTEHTGADVTISNGAYAVFWNDSCYDACCEDSLTDIMDAITTLYMADF